MLRKGLKREILILLATLVDEIDAWSFHNQMRRWLFDGWYKRSSFGPTVSKLLSVGEIEKIEKKGKPFYILTSRGSEKLKESIPIFNLANQKWDGRWRIVIFDIKEKKKFLRDGLRNKLLSLGFGMWQRSVYITPHAIGQEINQYLQSRRLFPSCACLVARRSDLGDDKALAKKVWHLNEFDEKYNGFINDCQWLAKKAMREGIGEKEIGNLWQEYKDLLLRDPHLPHELLPADWLAEKAREEFVRFCSNITRSRVVRAKRK